MGITNWSNGLSTSTGDAYVGYKPALVSGSVLWVDSVNGSDSNAGTLEELPKATLASAISAAGSNTADTIIIKSGHSETLSGSQAFTNKAGLTIQGLGSGSTRPRFTCSGAVDLLAVSVSDVWIENLYFVKSSGSATSRIKITAAGCHVVNCYFECGSSDAADTVLISSSGSNYRIDNCYFLANGTTSAQPARALTINAAVTGGVVTGCTFDGGTCGWSGAAFGNATGAGTYFRWLNNTMTGYSDVNISITAAKGTIAGVTQSGVGAVSWTP